jgi:hypothetical protein
LSFFFEEINAFKRLLKPGKTASSKKRKAESILYTEINLTTASFLRHIPQTYSSKQMTVIQPPGVQWVVSL